MSNQSLARGVMYLAFGRPYFEEARRSAMSVRESNPTLSIAIVTDQQLGEDPAFDHILTWESPVQSEVNEQFMARDRVSYYRKILPLLRSPFEKTVFLDSDTWVAGSLDSVFIMLERYEMLVTPAFTTVDYAFEVTEMPFSEIPEAFGYFNTGFLAYRRSAEVEAIIRKWMENFVTYVAPFTVNDQPALRFTLWQEDFRFHVLPCQFNVVSWGSFIIPGGGKVVMLHGRNPWLQKWVHHLSASRATIVGNLSARHLLVYHGARVLYAFQRLWRKVWR